MLFQPIVDGPAGFPQGFPQRRDAVMSSRLIASPANLNIGAAEFNNMLAPEWLVVLLYQSARHMQYERLRMSTAVWIQNFLSQNPSLPPLMQGGREGRETRIAISDRLVLVYHK